MEELRKKLRSQSGASILLALLLMLVCVMVGASVLMASAANMGKVRSNRLEQQKYLALSSALQLCCDELQRAKYTGKYTYTETTQLEKQTDPITGEEKEVEVTYYDYKQDQGIFNCKLTGPVLVNELDYLFAKKFERPPVGTTTYTKFDGTLVEPKEHTLEITAADPGGTNYPGLTDEKVTVRLLLDENYRIRLTATLEEAGGGAGGYRYTMEAELNCQNPPDITEGISGIKDEDATTWTLGWIAKEEVSAGGGETPDPDPGP